MNIHTCRLPQRGVLEVKGEDALPFLQGLLSNDLELCKLGKAIYSGFLNPQGKFLHDMIVVRCHDGFWLDCDRTRLSDLAKSLEVHKLRAKVNIEDISHSHSVWVTWGDVTPSSPWFCDPRRTELGFRAIFPIDHNPGVSVSTNPEEYDNLRIGLTVPDGARDLDIGKSNLIEGNFDRLNGISWTKGCYRGQELTARLHYRALIKKRLFTVRVEGPAPPPGSIIKFLQSEIGLMRSHQGNLGLALLDIHTALECSHSDQPLTTDLSQLLVVDTWTSVA